MGIMINGKSFTTAQEKVIILFKNFKAELIIELQLAKVN